MTAPPAPPEVQPGAPVSEEVEAAVAQVRARWAARQAARGEEERLRQARRAARRESRLLARQARADRAMDAAGGVGSLARRAAPVIGAAAPVAMVNGTAFIGQFAYIKDHVPWILPGQVLVAATFESVAVYLAWHAHLAMMKNDSSTRLKLGAQLFALIMGAMNYSHYSVNWHPTVMAVGLGLMSLLSPSLWGIYSRRAARDKLMERGLVEEHAVRLGANRWSWHPLRSVKVMWRATWIGENNPQRAIAMYEQAEASRRASREDRAAAPRQEALQGGAPVAQVTAPLAGAPEPSAPGGAPERPAPGWVRQEQDARRVIRSLATPPGGPLAATPGTQLNGAEVKAIAGLAARPTMKAQHEIDPQRIEEVELHLAGLPVSQLPAERAVSAMLCPGTGHNHRRKAGELIKARKEAGEDPVPAAVRRQRPSATIAAPVATLPGGKQANG